MKKILWVLVIVGACLVAAAALFADRAGEKAGEERGRRVESRRLFHQVSGGPAGAQAPPAA